MRKLLILTFILTIVSCASSYQSKDRGWIFNSVDGFTETQLSDNVYSVRFRGNSATDRQRVDDFTFLRCAELTIENGYSYFVIEDESEETDSNVIGGFGEYGGISTYNYPEAQKTIRMFKDEPQSGGFNAFFLRNSIKDKYDIE